MKKLVVAALGALLVFAAAAQAQEGAAAQANMQILMEKVKADKKLVVAANMDLTDTEANGFWPVYGDYQKELAALNQRLGKLINAYAEDYNKGALTDEAAGKLMDEALAIEGDEAAMRKKYADKLSKVLPGTKVMRYLQIESKIRAIIRYELAAGIPLATS